jgi:hypothetical protein
MASSIREHGQIGNAKTGAGSLDQNGLAVCDQTTLEVKASQEADVVLFLVDRKAPFSRAGTMSG